VVSLPVALTIAGVDSGGGAGIAADLKTFEAHGVWGTCAITAVTAQNTIGVHAVEAVSPRMVRDQIVAVASDIGVSAVKTGMLATAAHIRAVVEALEEIGRPLLVVDPVAVSKHGDPLLAEDAIDALRDELLPLATVVTPNLPEAEALTGLAITDRAGMEAAARALPGQVVLLKGGHLGGPDSPDLVWSAGQARWLEGVRLPGRHTHGTGCTLSAAITAELARGMDPIDACIAGKAFVTGAIRGGVPLGRGVGPVNPGWQAVGGGLR
jgi:hydroxymethylpyrimidine kinase/phosphomethylpyrimidine kinase